jgi:hypothetical protein
MAAKEIEISVAGCYACAEAVETVKRVAGSSRSVEVLDVPFSASFGRSALRSEAVSKVPLRASDLGFGLEHQGGGNHAHTLSSF